MKRDRGRVNHVDRDQGLAYWFRMNNNAMEDRTIQRMLPAMRDEMASLMADPEIAAAHEFSVKKHIEKINDLKATKTYAAFYEKIGAYVFDAMAAAPIGSEPTNLMGLIKVT